MTKKLLIMAGGTGGHVFPALAVAQCLIKQGWQVQWLGTADRMEAMLVPKHGININFIEISGLRGKGIFALLCAPFRISKAVFQARKIMKSYRPNVVLGMGGYVSGPGGIAAKLCGVPIVLHEQNGVAGLTNKWLAKIATRVLQAFPSAFNNVEVVGNPVREDILQLPAPEVRFADRPVPLRILIMGGSQGAKILNNIVPLAIKKLSYAVDVWHQAGKGMDSDVLALYEGVSQGSVKVTEFIDNVAEAYGWADVIICRSGALTVSEISVVGVGAIFVPFMHKDKQQYWNAKELADAGAAKIIEQPDFNVETLVDLLSPLNRNQLLEMAIKAKQTLTINSAKRVADVIKSVAK